MDVRGRMIDGWTQGCRMSRANEDGPLRLFIGVSLTKDDVIWKKGRCYCSAVGAVDRFCRPVG